MDLIGIPSMIIICYLVAEFFKLVILRKKRRYKYIPVIAGITGGLLGFISYIINPQIVLNVEDSLVAISLGIVSGLASTGSYETLKKMFENFNNRNKEDGDGQ